MKDWERDTLEQARILGNEVLSFAPIITLMYKSSHSLQHAPDAHLPTVDAFGKRGVHAAIHLIGTHIANVECNCDDVI